MTKKKDDLLQKALKVRERHAEIFKNNPLSPALKEFTDKLKDPEYFKKRFEKIKKDCKK